MAKTSVGSSSRRVSNPKKTSQGGKRPKTASMNKAKKLTYKKYRGQGR
jgi:hypothetical protein